MLGRCVQYVSARLAEGRDNKHCDFLKDFLEVAGGQSAPNVPLVITWLMHNVSCYPHAHLTGVELDLIYVIDRGRL